MSSSLEVWRGQKRLKLLAKWQWNFGTVLAATFAYLFLVLRRQSFTSKVAVRYIFNHKNDNAPSSFSINHTLYYTLINIHIPNVHTYTRTYKHMHTVEAHIHTHAHKYTYHLKNSLWYLKICNFKIYLISMLIEIKYVKIYYNKVVIQLIVPL